MVILEFGPMHTYTAVLTSIVNFPSKRITQVFIRLQRHEVSAAVAVNNDLGQSTLTLTPSPAQCRSIYPQELSNRMLPILLHLPVKPDGQL